MLIEQRVTLKRFHLSGHNDGALELKPWGTLEVGGLVAASTVWHAHKMVESLGDQLLGRVVEDMGNVGSLGMGDLGGMIVLDMGRLPPEPEVDTSFPSLVCMIRTYLYGRLDCSENANGSSPNCLQ